MHMHIPTKKHQCTTNPPIIQLYLIKLQNALIVNNIENLETAKNLETVENSETVETVENLKTVRTVENGSHKVILDKIVQLTMENIREKTRKVIKTEKEVRIDFIGTSEE